MSTTLADVMSKAGPGCWALREALVQHRTELGAGDADVNDVELLASVAALRLDPRDRQTPLGSVMPGRIPGPSQLTDAALSRLRELITEIPSADLRARAWDLLWLRSRRDHDAASSALSEYLVAARNLATAEHNGWDTPATRLRRAQSIARALSSETLMAAVGSAIEDFVRDEAFNGGDRVPAAEVLAQWKGDAARLAGEVAEKLGQDAIALAGDGGFNWDWVRYAFGVAAEAYKAAGDPEAHTRLLGARAATYVQHADWLEPKPGVSLFLVADLLRRGVQAARDLGASAREVEALHARLLRTQEASTKELGRHSTPKCDVTDAAKHAIAAVSGEPFVDALMALVKCVPLTPRASLLDLVGQQRRQFPLGFLFSRTSLDRHGRTLAVRGAGTMEGNDAELGVHALESAGITRGFLSVAVINPARAVISVEHPALLEDWVAFLAERPLAQPSRSQAIATGLAAGLRGDFITTVAVLVPQLEHMVRLIVTAAGGITSTLDPRDGTQQEAMLGSLLKKDEVLKVLGEDLLFDLCALVDGDGGANLRNRFAHGLMDDDDFNSADALYLWFSVLRLLVLVGRAEGPLGPTSELPAQG